MKLDHTQLRRLLFLLGLRENGRLAQTDEAEIRRLVALEGYTDYAKTLPVDGLVNLSYGILSAYYLVDGVDVTAEAA